MLDHVALCGGSYRLGVNVVLNENGEGVFTGSCSNHCNQVRDLSAVIAGQYMTHCEAADVTKTSTTTATSTVTTYTQDPNIKELDAKLLELATKLAAGGPVDTVQLQAEVVLLQASLHPLD